MDLTVVTSRLEPSLVTALMIATAFILANLLLTACILGITSTPSSRLNLRCNLILADSFLLLEFCFECFAGIALTNRPLVSAFLSLRWLMSLDRLMPFSSFVIALRLLEADRVLVGTTLVSEVRDEILDNGCRLDELCVLPISGVDALGVALAALILVAYGV